jgi:O-acetyl-ADP-ribose deacetylase (regulator of RNase III)
MPATIELVKSDITVLRVDAIVNAANESLQLGAGVAGAIRRAGGRTIQEECDKIGHCPTGEAVVTGGGNLPARWVIHAVGPVWRGGDSGEEMQLTSAVLAALKRAEEIGAKSVALPALSTGVYGFPLAQAAQISIATARAFAPSARGLRRILFALYDEATLKEFQKTLEEAGE